jgi:hypothetical protein
MDSGRFLLRRSLMLITLNDFLHKIETAPYLYYKLYSKDETLFITLCTSEELEQYLIKEMIPKAEHPHIITALEKGRQVDGSAGVKSSSEAQP